MQLDVLGTGNLYFRLSW